MSDWDFGRPRAGHDDPAAGHGDSLDSRSPAPRAYEPGQANYRHGFDGSPGDEWADDLDHPLTGPYPVSYERDEDGLPAGWAPWSQPNVDDRLSGGPLGDNGPGNARANAGPWLDGFDEARPGAKPNPDENADAGQPTRVWPDGPLTQQRWLAVRDTPTLTDVRRAGPAGRAGPAVRRGGGRRWLIPASIGVVGAALGATAVLLIGGHQVATSPASRGPASPGGTDGQEGSGTPARGSSPVFGGTGPLTVAQAQSVLAGYSAANNTANAQRSDSRLGAIETGSSYAIDAGQYQIQLAAGAAAYPAFGAVQATYYIPRGEQASGPRWFAVQVGNAFSSDPQKVASTEYLVFTQAAPGDSWRDAVEPYALTGANTPQVAIGADGLATAVSPTATSVAVPPGQLAAVTAASLDGSGQMASPGNLADQSDQRFWAGKLPAATVTDTHAAAAGPDGQEFALRTTDGGALVFYTDTATLTITPPRGSALHLTVPGYYSPAATLSSASLNYLDQFASYDPPADGNGGAARVVADYSGITGKN